MFIYNLVNNCRSFLTCTIILFYFIFIFCRLDNYFEIILFNNARKLFQTNRMLSVQNKSLPMNPLILNAKCTQRKLEILKGAKLID